MNIETCYKYFEFLNTECDRYLRDGRIDEDEIHQLKIEFDRFIENAVTSELPIELQQKIAELRLEYEYQPLREYHLLMGPWNFGRNRRQRRILRLVESFKHQIEGLPMFIKMNY